MARRSSWGSNEPAGRGKRRLRWWGIDERGRYRRMSETIEGTRKDGDHRLAELRLKHDRDAPCPTLAECWGRWWLPDAESLLEQGKISKTTLNNSRTYWRRYIEPRWGGVPVNAMRPIEVQEWLSSGMTGEAASRCRSLMKRIIDYPFRYELVDRNVMAIDYVMPVGGSKQRDKGIWTLDELVGPVWDAVRDTPCEGPFLLAAFGSCRVGESLACMAGEVELISRDGASFAVYDMHRQMHNGGYVTERLKTRYSKRMIVVPGTPGERLYELSEAAVANGTTWLDGSLSEKPMLQETLSSVFRDALRAKGCEVHPFTNLRNSWQTYMQYELEVPKDARERLMGHSGNDTTGRYYDRPVVEQLVSIVAKCYMRRPF